MKLNSISTTEARTSGGASNSEQAQRSNEVPALPESLRQYGGARIAHSQLARHQAEYSGAERGTRGPACCGREADRCGSGSHDVTGCAQQRAVVKAESVLRATVNNPTHKG